MRRPAIILTDIEGTTTPIAFVRNVLFPYARAHLAAFLDAEATRPDVSEILQAVVHLAPDRPPLDALLGWMDADAKVTPLKALQGLIWEAGYRDGSLRGDLYPDVAPALRRWHAAGIALAVYSSGSVAAQRLLFAHSVAGDLSALFTAFHDTTTGPKQDAASYRRIRGPHPDRWLFLSDVPAELDAAASAGLQVCQLIRPNDGTTADPTYPHAVDFDALERLWQD